jgi:cell pole-organizing protein PopZ
VDPDDAAGIERALAEIAADPDGFAARVHHPRPEVIARFDRRKQAAQLAEIFDRVAKA